MLHKLPKRAARIITNSSYEVRSADIFKTMHWEPIENILNRREQVMTFMALQEMIPKCLTELFSNNRNYIYQKCYVCILVSVYVSYYMHMYI